MLKYFSPNPQWLIMKTADNETPLKVAVKYGRLDLLKELWPNISTLINQTNFQCVHADTNHPFVNVETNSDTVLNNILLRFYWSCRQIDRHQLIGKEIISNILMDQSFEPNYYREDGFTPLMVAVKYRHVEYVELLLKSPFCNMKVLEKRSFCFKRTVLHICADIRDEKITDLLLNKAQMIGLNVTAIDVMGDTPLHVCAKKNNIHMCEGLLSLRDNYPQLIFDPKTNKTQLEMRNNDGLTPLHEATRRKRYEIVKSMLKFGDDSEQLKQLIMPTVKNLRTSLHLAALKGK